MICKLLECSTTGDVYFRLLEYLGDAVNKVILGQTASSGDSSGLSKGDAQSKVRQDILEGDCQTLQRVIDAQLIKPWMRFNYGETVPVPHLVIECAAPEDEVSKASVLKTLYEAGFEADAAEVSEAFGWKLTKRTTGEKPGALTMSDASLSDTSDRSDRPDKMRQDNILAKITALAGREDLSDEDFKRALLAMTAEGRNGAGLEDFEEVIRNVIAAGIAAGREQTRRVMRR